MCSNCCNYVFLFCKALKLHYMPIAYFNIHGEKISKVSPPRLLPVRVHHCYYRTSPTGWLRLPLRYASMPWYSKIFSLVASSNAPAASRFWYWALPSSPNLRVMFSSPTPFTVTELLPS